VPTVVLLDAGEERDRVEGLDTARLGDLAQRAGVALELDGLPAHRPGCASLTRDPGRRGAPRRSARAGDRADPLAHADGRRPRGPVEALHDRGVTDGLPVVPPTAERVVALLEGTSRDPQDLVARCRPTAAGRPSRRWPSTR
jgi:hypothetical protein